MHTTCGLSSLGGGHGLGGAPLVVVRSNECLWCRSQFSSVGAARQRMREADEMGHCRVELGEEGRREGGSRNMGSFHTSIENLVQPNSEKYPVEKTTDRCQSPAKKKFRSAEQSNEHRMISPHREHYAEVPKKSVFLLTTQGLES